MHSSIRILFLHALGALCLVALNGCFYRPLQLKETSDSTVRAIVVGDARWIEEGNADASTMKEISPRMFKFGIGTGAVVPDASQQSNSVVLGRAMFVSPLVPKQTAEVEYTSLALYSSFLTGIPPRTKPAAIYRIRWTISGTPLSELYHEIVRRHGENVVIIGTGKFVRLNGSTMANAPTGSNAGSKEANRTSVRLKNTKALFGGMLLDSPYALNKTRRLVFPLAPGMEDQVDELSQVNFARLRSLKGINLEDPETASAHVQSVGRLDTDSVIKSGELHVYLVDDLEVR